MEQHVKILGILYIVIGGLGVAAALILFGILGGIAGVASSVIHLFSVPFSTALGIYNLWVLLRL